MKEETKLQNKITSCLDYLIKSKHAPIIYEKRVNRGFAYKKGSPDLWLAICGTHIEIELKVNDNERTPLQIKWEKRCRERHCPYWLLYSFEEFMFYLKKILSFEGYEKILQNLPENFNI